MELKRLNIENLIPGMQNVDIAGTITRATKKNYSTQKGSGVLASLVIADQSGSIRLTLWNDEIDRVGDIHEGDVVKVVGYVRQGMYGPELRLGRFGKLEKLSSRGARRASISGLQEGQKKELRATLVQLFESNPFYEVCPQCNVTVKEEKDEYKCITHGIVSPAYALRVSGILDDGTACVRCVAFKETAEKILGMDVGKAKDLVLRKGVPALFAQAKLGEFIFKGAARRNRLFERLEFIIDEVGPFDVKEEIEILLEQAGQAEQA
jgi:hypothetical protein